MRISVFSSLFSIIVALWAFSILDFRLIFGCVLYEGRAQTFFQNIDLQNPGASYLRRRLTRGEIRYTKFFRSRHFIICLGICLKSNFLKAFSSEFFRTYYPLSARGKEERTLFWSHNMSQFFLKKFHALFLHSTFPSFGKFHLIGYPTQIFFK